MKESFDEAIGGFADDYCVWLGDILEPGGYVRSFADYTYRIRVGSIGQTTHDGQTSVNGDANLQRLLQPRAQPRDGCYNFKAGAYRASRIIFMRYRIAEIYKEAVAEKLGDMTAVTAHQVGADPLVLARQIVQLFGIELSGKRSRPDQVAEHNGQAATFGLRRELGVSFREGTS
jgi:hypothetical protein